MLAALLAFATSKLLIMNEERQFVSWMRTNNQFFTGNDYHLRLGIFMANSRWVQEFNKKASFRVALNKFSCFTPTEYEALLGAKLPEKNAQTSANVKVSAANAPESYDWREHGVVNPVKDQAQCGSCWAFSAIATCETSYAIKNSKLLSFSEQNIVDCDNSCYGCGGGWPSNAITYVVKKQKGQFNSEDDYPYHAVDQTCTFDQSKGIGHVSGYKTIPNESDLKEKVASLGVASVCIDCGHPEFMQYQSGICTIEGCSQTFLNHAVAVVGYGAENGVEFWIVRNSWGTSWGEEGHIRMRRNYKNMCGIATTALVATA